MHTGYHNEHVGTSVVGFHRVCRGIVVGQVNLEVSVA